jgi:glycosyltransferase involved in cell wall biosynthesis
VVTTLQEDFPRYYHKAMAAWAWFKEYLSGGKIKGLPPLQAVMAAAKPYPYMTSPFAAVTANLLFACGKTEAALLASLYPNARSTVVPFGSSAADAPAPPTLFEETFHVKDFVLCVGRVEPRKNQLMLLHSLEESDLAVVFADGGFTYQPDYIALCKQFPRRGRTIFTGRLSDELLASAYRACRLHCLPSWYELPGLVSLEAAAHGCPVVASSWGCLPDYLGDTVAWCAPDDPASIRDAIEKCSTQERSRKSSDQARSFSWETFGDETLRHYERVLQEHTGFTPAQIAAAATICEAMTLPAFISRITDHAEKGDMSGALRFYDEHRGRFNRQANELSGVDGLMETLRAKLNNR